MAIGTPNGRKIPMTIRGYSSVLAVAALTVLLSVPAASATPAPTSRSGSTPEVRIVLVLTHSQAVSAVRTSGGAVHDCWRIAPRHFRCKATWWYERHEAEVEPDGSLVNETIAYLPEELTCEVGLKGLTINYPAASRAKW
jgi:hypothetical protein